MKNMTLTHILVFCAFFVKVLTHRHHSHEKKLKHNNQYSDARSKSWMLLQNALSRHRKTQQMGTFINLHDQLKNALIQTQTNQPSVLVINQTPKFKIVNPETDSNYRDMKIGYGSTFSNPQKSCNNGTDKNTFKFGDIPGIVTLAQALADLYDGFYEAFPDKSGLQQKWSVSEITNKTIQILTFYTSVRDFVVKIYKSQDEITKNFNAIQNKVKKLQTNEMDMLAFFNLEDKYSNIKIKSYQFESLDPTFKYYYKSIEVITINFQINAQQVFSVVSQMVHYGQTFMTSIKALINLGFNDESLNFMKVLTSIDTVLTSVSTLADIELELKNAITATKASLQNLILFRDSINESLDNISNLADLYALKGPAFVNSDSFLFKSTGFAKCVIISILLAFFVGNK